MTRYDCDDRKRHCKSAALSLAGAGRDDRAAVRMHEFACNGETKPQSALTPRFRALCLTKAIENVREKIGVDALTVIKYLNLCLRSNVPPPDVNVTAAGRELDRI